MKLHQIYSSLWECLADAAREDSRPFNRMQAATIGLDGIPNVRTIALRHVDEPENRIGFHTDLRSPKVAELDSDPRIALVGIDPDRGLQIRVSGKARIVRDGPVRAVAWNTSADHHLIQYRTLLAPGTPISQPEDAFGEKGKVAGPDEGLRHFCVVEVAPVRLDWLDLSVADRPLRARFLRSGDTWTSGWVAP